MLCTRVSTKLCSPKQAIQLGRAAAPLSQGRIVLGSPAGLRLAIAVSQSWQHGPASRPFSTTSAVRMKDFFPATETEHIRQTLPAWPHKGYTYQEMLDVVPGHREPVTFGDKFAWKFMRFCRYALPPSPQTPGFVEDRPS